MKKVILLIAVFLSVTSCSDAIFMTQQDISSLVLDDNNVASSLFSFDSITQPNVWRSYNSLEEMQKACQIPNDVLTSLSTRELTEICMRYPLMGDYLAFNDPIMGIKHIINGFNGLQELLKRNDGIECLIDYYDKIDVEEIAEKSILKSTDTQSSSKNLIHLGYIELLFAYSFGPQFQTANNIDWLKKVYTRKSSIKRLYPSVFGKVSQEISSILEKPLNQDNSNNADLQKHTDSSVSTLSGTSITVYTKGGKSIIGYIYPEMTESELFIATKYVKDNYSNATILSPATSSYNCHSYAWNMTDGGDTCWINATISSTNDNLCKYWTNDYYSQTADVQSAEKIFYLSGDHSAIPSSMNGLYESKWGRCPLMRHLPAYCPYDMTNMNYFAHIDKPVVLAANASIYSNYSESTVGSGVILSYSYSSNDPSATIEIVVYNAKGDESGNNQVTISLNKMEQTAFVTFHSSGFFTGAIRVYSSSGDLLTEALTDEIIVGY